ncbi:MAG: ankyrin repeat domain-containing protein [Aeromicrobium erythreum]
MSDEPGPEPRETTDDAQAAIDLAHRLLDAARSGDEGLLAYVDRGVPVDLTDAGGNTLLMLAAYHGHTALVAGLLARGADADRPNDRGQTPLAGAVFKGDDATAGLLLAAGADPDAGTPSARATAEMFGQQDLLR